MPSIRVIEISQQERDPQRRLRWGDYWVGRYIVQAAESLGYIESSGAADVLVHSWGAPQPLPDAGRRILWLSSHPQYATTRILRQYDRRFCQSRRVTEMIRERGLQCDYLMGATAQTPQDRPALYDAVFVGNPKGNSRWCIEAVAGMDVDLAVWGERWDALGDAWRGICWPGDRLGELYGAARIVINDHHADMRLNGFVNGRIFDSLACGTLCISDNNDAVAELFGDTVPMADTPERLRMLVQYYLEHDNEREALAKRGQAIALQYSYDAVVERMLEGSQS